jgi:purine-cytosine permease-like protein
MAVSWAPLAADYSRHSRNGAAALGGALVGYGAAAIAYFGLGVLALATIVGVDGDVLASLLAVPAGGLALAILAIDEVDEAFANVYSTAVSTQNLFPRVDRRVLAVVVGVLAVALALVADVTSYESFLLLIGSVFVPLFAVAIADFFLVRRGGWDVSETARGRWALVLPWAAGFAAYQLVNPGAVGWWSGLWIGAREAIGFTPQSWMSASLVSFAVAAILTLLVGWRRR